MQVFVLGHRGMLGHVVARRLAQAGHRVLTTEARYDGAADSALVREVAGSGCEAVVNAAGRLRPGPGPSEALLVANALLPQHLAAALGGRLLVHASSDDVFSGARGDYRVDEPPDALDPYGLSKRLGERALELGRAVVLRCSIVGPDPQGGRGLLAWFLGQPGPLDGYDHHRWNGVTTLQWAELCLQALRGELGPGLHQPACAQPLTKREVLEAFAQAYGHRVEIWPVRSGPGLDRTLRPTLAGPPLAEQLRALRAWYEA